MSKCDICENLINGKRVDTIDSPIMRDFISHGIENVCASCYEIALDKYLSGLECFEKWLDQNKKKECENLFEEFLRNGYDVSYSLLQKDREKYEENLEKYAAFLENFIYHIANKKHIDLRSEIKEFRAESCECSIK